MTAPDAPAHWTPNEPRTTHGDRWMTGLPLLWQACADPNGPWQAPPVPKANTRDTSRWPYWNPLLHLLFGPLGWADPALGARRWVDLDGPDPDPFTWVMRRWWGPDVQMLAHWPQADRIAEAIWEQLGVRWRLSHCVEPLRTPHEEWPGSWPGILSGGGDPLHLIFHVPPLLTHGWGLASALWRYAGDGAASSVLLLSDYRGWLAHLYGVGEQEGAVDVVCKPYGWLGTYRRSPVTDRWYACDHDIHLLGWPDGEDA